MMVTAQDCFHSVQLKKVLMVDRLFKFYRSHADTSVKNLF